MAIGILRAEGVERGYAALIGFAELYVVPVALVVALCLRWSARLRARARPVVAATAAGAIVVVLATLIVGNGGNLVLTPYARMGLWLIFISCRSRPSPRPAP